MTTDVEMQSAQSTLEHLETGVTYTMLKNTGIMEVSGEDALKFLQNQTTNDVTTLEDGQGCLNTAVDRQGKIQGLFSLHRHGERYWLILDRNSIEGLIEHLKKFIIMEQVNVGNRSKECRLLAIQGAQATQLLQEGNPELASELSQLKPYSMLQCRLFDCPIMVMQKALTPFDGYIIVTEEYTLPRLLDGMYECDVNLAEIDEANIEPFRIEAGLLRFEQDYTAETLLPETGLETECVNYNKGCYLGQEVIARVKTYGSPQKKLVGVEWADLSSTDIQNQLKESLPSDIQLDGNTIGHLTSIAFSPSLSKLIGLAYIDKTHRTPDQSLDTSIEGHDSTVTIKLLPFVKNRGTNTPSDFEGKHAGEPIALADDLFQSALMAFSEGMDEQAIEQLRQVLSQNPDNIDAMEALGAILYRTSDSTQEKFLETVDEAIALMEQILEKDPDHLMAHTNLSIYWLAKGDKDRAEEEKAKATIAKMRQHAKKAGLDFSKLEEERKQAEATQKKQLEERIELFIEALSHSPDDPLGNFGLGSAYMELMRFEEAIAPLQKTIEGQPKHTVAYLSLGKALAATGKQDEARKIFTKGVEVASERGDLMPLNEMKQRLNQLN